jgi:glutathione S-transferase
MTDALVLHEDPISGNCYKIRLVAAHVGAPLERRSYDITKGETRTPDFLATVNPVGRIPVLQIGATMLPESNAACWFLAEGTEWVPSGKLARAQLLRWLFWEQYNHEPNVATLRFWRGILGEGALSGAQRALLPAKEAAAAEAIRVLDEQLAVRPFLLGDTASLADLVLYPYTHVAEEGGVSLAAAPHVAAWLKRIAVLPGHVPMDA